MNIYAKKLKIVLNKEIRTKELIDIFGTENLIKRYFKDKSLGGNEKKQLLSKARKYCVIDDLGKGKFIVLKIFDEKLSKVDINNPLYSTYHNMKYRCYNKSCPSYDDYGGRGIDICDEWLNKKNGIHNFIKWSEENGYIKNSGLSIDRIDNDMGYSPYNCRWVTWDIQSANKRNTRNRTVENSDYNIKHINGLYLAYFYYKFKIYPVGTFETLEEAIEQRDKLKNYLLLRLSN